MLIKKTCVVLFCVTAGLFAFLSSCNCVESLPVSKIMIDRVPGANSLDLNRDETVKVVTKILSKNKNFKLDLDDSKNGVFRVNFRFAPAKEDQSKERLVVGLKYVQSSVDNFKQLFGSGSVLFEKGETVTDLYEKVFAKGLKDLLSVESSKEKSSERALNIIDGYLVGDMVPENILLKSIQVLDIKKEKKSVGQLSKLLLGDNEKIALTALLALSNIADSSAIDAVVKFAERKNPEIRKQVILAARQMGGVKAAAWLFTLSTGYPDRDVNVAASRALVVVEAKIHDQN